MSSPGLPRCDRVFHQGVTRLEVLRSLQLFRLHLHFLDLTPLRVYLGTRVNQGDCCENRSGDSGQNACINIHSLISSFGEKLPDDQPISEALP
jgi:hypothetical protein